MTLLKHVSFPSEPGAVVQPLRCARPRSRWSFVAAGLWLAVALVLLAAAGCGGTRGPQLGVISVTSPGASAVQVTTVATNAQVNVSVAVGQDNEKLGVNWSVFCLGSSVTPQPANPCGTIAPAYVGSSISMVYTAPAFIPAGNTVVITASATSSPSTLSSVTLTVVPPAITIAINQAPPAMLGTSATALLTATVTNDDSAAGVNWAASCGTAGACGTFQSGLPNAAQSASGGQLKYVAPAAIPAGGTVTITATSVKDASKSASATVTIAPVGLTVAPAAAAVPVGTTASLTGTVTFDTAAKGVDWGAPVCGSAGACGSVSPVHTASGDTTVYTAPLAIPTGTTVSITAKATADATAAKTVVLTIAPPPPIAVSITPATASAQVNGSAALVATVANDPAGKGADWTVSCGTVGACGSITAHTASGSTASFVAPVTVPAGGTVTVTATSTADATKSFAAAITIVPAIGISFTPALTSPITAGTAASFTATVTNDGTNAGVDWAVSCSSAPCGIFNSGTAGALSHTASGAAISFTAPITMPAGTVTITATSTASGNALPVRSVSSTLTVTPVISLSFVPFAPVQMQVADVTVFAPTPAPLTAVVLNDATSAGVDWSVCATVATCGEFQVTPPIAATATKAAVNAVYAATVHTTSGQAALYVPPTQAGTVSITAKAHNPAATASVATQTAMVAVVHTPLGVALQGTVLAGTTPVKGAAVYLYAAGTTGYSSAATPLMISGSANNVATGTAGQFAIPAGYNCPSQLSQMYLVALGGDAGAGNNPNLAMMTALGACGSLNANVSVVINEVTTVGLVWALAPFMADYGHVGSSSANATAGMANAFASVNNLVNVLNGQALTATPAGNGVAPRTTINTVADILNGCTSTGGGAVGDGSACGLLFATANPSLIIANAPLDTIKAAVNIAQNPAFNTSPGPGTVYSLLPVNDPFTPFLTTMPNDWTISINYTGGGLNSRSAATGLAVDAQGNLWITNQRFNSVTELNGQGAALSPTGAGTTQATAGGFQGDGVSLPGPIAIDALGNAWIANNGSISEMGPLGVALSNGGVTGGGLGSNVKGIAIDGPGNIWAVTSGSPGTLAWFAGANTTINGTPQAPGTALSPGTGYTQGISNPSGAIQVDTAGTVWVLNSGNNTAAEFSSSNGSFIQTDHGYTQTVPVPVGSVLSQGVGSTMAIDNAGNVFLSPGGQLLELLAGGSVANDGGLGAASTASGNRYSQFMALDGAEHFWLLITGGSNFCTSTTSVVEMSSGGAQLNTNSAGCGYLGTGINVSDVAIAVDGAGNVWVLNSGSITELVGVATPVVTPFSVGVQSKTLGKRP